jgi:hypothetical protein
VENFVLTTREGATMTQHKLRLVLFATLVLVACSASTSSPSSPGSIAPTSSVAANSPIIEQTTEQTGVGLVVKFKLARAANCTMNTDGELLNGQAATQNRPKGVNLWAVTGGTQATVTCE